MPKKAFDCVEMKRDIQKRLHEELDPASVDDYYDKLIHRARSSALWQEFKMGLRGLSKLPR